MKRIHQSGKGEKIMERIYAVVQGQVQGVGFRWIVQSLANSLQITGWIRNMENGMVEMELQGETAALHQLLSRIRKGDRFIQVENLSSKPISVQLREKRFSVKY